MKMKRSIAMPRKKTSIRDKVNKKINNDPNFWFKLSLIVFVICFMITYCIECNRSQIIVTPMKLFIVSIILLETGSLVYTIRNSTSTGQFEYWMTKMNFIVGPLYLLVFIYKNF